MFPARIVKFSIFQHISLRAEAKHYGTEWSPPHFAPELLFKNFKWKMSGLYLRNYTFILAQTNLVTKRQIKMRRKDEIICHNYHLSNFCLRVNINSVALAISAVYWNFTAFDCKRSPSINHDSMQLPFILLVTVVTVFQWLTKISGSYHFIFTVPWEFNLEACVFPSQGEEWMSLSQSSWTSHLV